MKKVLIVLAYTVIMVLFVYLVIRIYLDNENHELDISYLLNDYTNEIIISDNKKIEYPVFNIKELDSKLSEFVSEYKDKENIDITYEIHLDERLLNIFFNIKENEVNNYKSINYYVDKKTIVDNNFIFDFNILNDELLRRIKNKYSTEIYNIVLLDNFKSASVKMTDEGIYIYYNDSLFNNLPYKVYMFFPYNDERIVSEELYDKVIAFTFDDGPSEYTLSIVDSLIENDSKATFFELGNRMKYNQEIVKSVLNKGMEIGSHTYSHKNLIYLNESEIEEEINSTMIIFKEITDEDIHLTRMPYGNANRLVISKSTTPIISWSIDTNDWLYRDSDYIYNHILSNAKDGDIVLMHDIYPETLEAVKKVLPALKANGFKITTVSELANIKGKKLEVGRVYRFID